MTQTTHDGQPITPDPPFGASIIVYRRTGDQVEFLILHRAHHGIAYEGDWAWTPPAGARWPGEPPDEGAQRELKEETGLETPIQPTNHGTLSDDLLLSASRRSLLRRPRRSLSFVKRQLAYGTRFRD